MLEMGKTEIAAAGPDPDQYAFIAASDAVKVALPQDEYDHTEILDSLAG